MLARIVFFIFCTINLFGQITPKTVFGLELWLRADTNVTFNTITNGVSLWNDLSGNNNNAIQSTVSQMPTHTQNSLLGNKPSIRFSASLLKIDNALTMGTCFTLVNFSGNSTLFPDFNGLLTQQSSGANDIIFIGNAGTSFFFPGFFGNNVFVNKVNTTNLSPLNNLKIIMGSTTPNNLLNLQIGNDRNFGGRGWIGDVAEIIIYSTILTDEEKNVIYNYFYKKYGSKINLGADKCVPKGHILKPSQSFSSYLWSTSATTSGIAINTPGKYWLKATDTFGQISSDTINILQVIDTKKPLTSTVCINDTLMWNTLLPNSQYAINWNGLGTNSGNSFAITTTGGYNVKITDVLSGCSVNDTLQITTAIGNNLLANIAIGGDTAVCSGNTIGLINGANLIKTYSWSNGSNSPTILITSAGVNTVRVRDFNTCTAILSKNVMSIIGFAPFASINYDSLCSKNIVQFTDMSVPAFGNSITKRYWQFNNGLVDSLNSNPTLTVGGVGNMVVKFIVKSNNNCQSILQKSLPIHPKPKINFNNTDVCAGLPMNFASLVTLSSGIVASYNWNFDAGATSISILQNPNFTFTSTGTYRTMLTVTSDKSCRDTVSKIINVRIGIPVNFSYSSECAGNTVFFKDATQYPDNQTAFTRIWEFGDSTFTSILAPSKTYTQAGIYSAKLSIITAANNCQNTITKPVVVKGYPTANFTITGNCDKSATQFLSSSSSLADTISTYRWDFGNGKSSTLKSPNYTYADSGNYTVKLDVVANGCKSSITKNITIHTRPVAKFSTNPVAGVAPLNVLFINQSKFADIYIWNLGKTLSNEKSPFANFTENGNYLVKLQVFNNFGCVDSSKLLFNVNKPNYDIRLDAVSSIKNDSESKLKFIIKITNSSNRDVDSVWIKLDLPNGISTYELFMGKLKPSQDTIIALSNLISMNIGISHYCVSINLPNSYVENVYQNNTLCQVLTSKPIIYDAYPNPTSGDIKISFSLPDPSDVEISLSDLVGKKYYQARAPYKKGFYSSNLALVCPSGIYMLSLKIGNAEKIQKIIIY